MNRDEFDKSDGYINTGDETEPGSADARDKTKEGETQGQDTNLMSAGSTREVAYPSLVGSRLGDYQLLRKLGRGGMADVYAARQLSLGREVALKVLRPDFARDNDYIHRFRREARAAAKLNHPNIVQVYEVGNVDSIHYIAQELVDGENLRQSLDRNGVIGTEGAIEVLVGVASALEVAAEAGITHRDIKPENVMRNVRGIIKVADFGLARIGTDVDATQSNLTQVGLTLGTPRYMSPEQVQGKTVDTRSDLYSLGITAYHLLAGRPPFEAEDSLALALMHLHETPVPLDRNRARYNSDGEPDLPEWLIAVVSRLMSKLPQDRFQSPSELLDAMDSPQDWDQTLSAYTAARKPAGDAILELALRNYIEMRDKTGDPQFLLQKRIEAKLAKTFPGRWLPLYSQVTFSHTPYEEALAAGKRQDRIMESILAQPDIATRWDRPETFEQILTEWEGTS